ncbi:MAG: trypsin-like peptidase domain-containing protein [Acidobacteriia bacterium]|nr:trypsin-like peptidase domain-containing protein [Terriglobia bacterium]
MKAFRPFLWAAVLVAGFIYLTSGSHWNAGSLFRSSGSAGPLWTEASAAANFTPDEQNNIEIYKTARDATVNITSKAYQQDWFWRIVPVEGAGSGFIIRQSGEILTNYHVVRGATELSVTLGGADKKTYKARLLGTEARSDLALIKIEADRKLPTLPLGNSDALSVGQKVLAIGNPFGQFGGTLTTGVVSSLDRHIQTEEGSRMEGMIQTDAAINPGNSGGPLLDSHGSVIGINTAIYGPQGNIGIGFALPINRAKAMLDQFDQSGTVTRAAPIGISGRLIDGDLAEALHLPRAGGLLVESVESGSAADEAGLHGANREIYVNGVFPVAIGGDLIVAVDGQPVETSDALRRAASRKRAGAALALTIFRDGRNQTVQVKLRAAPKEL